MATWLKFISDYDHRHDSRAVTAYKAGDVVYTPTHIARVALAKGKAVETEKPTGNPVDEAGDGRRIYIEDAHGC